MTHNEGSLNESRPLRSLLVAVIAGCLVAVIAVLPAEYGIDPTGAGAALGLNVLAEGTPEPAPSPTDRTGKNRLQRTLTLEPGQGIEVKVIATAGERVEYRWLASKPLHFDLHGEPAGDTSGYFESYAVGISDGISGQFAARYDGTHGWYWRNDASEAVTVELLAVGDFALQ